MHRTVLYLLAVALITVQSFAGTVVYRGERPGSFKQIGRLAAALASDQGLADRVTALLNGEGYLDARVQHSGDSLIIEAGARARLGRIVVTGDSTFEIKGGGYFVRGLLEEPLERELRCLYDQGYYYAAVQITSVRRVGPTVEIDATLNRGPMVRVADVLFVGLERSRPELIERLLPIGRGDTLTTPLLRRTEAAADRIGYLVFRPPIRVLPQPGYSSAVLELQFEEKRQFRIEGSGGYLPDNSTGLVWSLQIGFTNMFGAGRQALVRSERREKGRNSLELQYRQPMFLAGAGELSLSAATRDYRDQFYEFAAAARYDSRIRADWNGGVELGYKTVTPVDDQPSFARYNLILSLGHETFEPTGNPQSGWGMDWSLAYAHRRYGGDSLSADLLQQVFNDTRAEVSLQLVQKVWRRLVMQLVSGYRGYRTAEPLPPASELYLVGGPGSLRGFRNEQFAAIHTARATLESRLRFERAYLFLFYDAAYLNNRVRNVDDAVVTQERYRYGFGLGLAVVEPGRRLKLSLDWNPDIAFDQPRLSVEFSADI